MDRFKLRHRLLLVALACLYMAASYMLVSVAFTLEGFLSLDVWTEFLKSFVNTMQDFGMVFWFSFFGSVFWAISCYLLAAYTRGFFRLAVTITAISSTVWSALILYISLDFKNIFIAVAYSYDLSHLLVRILPYFLTAVNCISLVLFAAGLALRFKGMAISIVSALALSVFMVSALAFLLNLNRFLPSAFFVVILPAGFLLLAIAIFRASFECGR